MITPDLGQPVSRQSQSVSYRGPLSQELTSICKQLESVNGGDGHRIKTLSESGVIESRLPLIDGCGGHPLVKQVVTLSFNAKVDLADF